jgi:hypothetical protein
VANSKMALYEYLNNLKLDSDFLRMGMICGDRSEHAVGSADRRPTACPSFVQRAPSALAHPAAYGNVHASSDSVSSTLSPGT